MGTRFLVYDGFKLIVLLVLLVLLLAFSRCSTQPLEIPAAAAQLSEETPPQEQPAELAAEASAGSAQPEGDEGASETQTQPEDETSEGSTAQPESQAQSAAAAELSAACPKALPVQLSGTGIRARVVNVELPLRRSPQVADNIIRMMLPGTQLDVIGLPICTELLSGANNWWKVRLPDGSSGFAAEGSAIKPSYYLEEIP